MVFFRQAWKISRSTNFFHATTKTVAIRCGLARGLAVRSNLYMGFGIGRMAGSRAALLRISTYEVVK